MHSPIGHKDWAPWVVDSKATVDEVLKGAWDRGVNTWDTANVYSNGINEEMIGNAIRKHNIPRHKLVLLSKCAGIVGEEPGVTHVKYLQEMKRSKDYVNQGGLSRTAIFNAVDASLARLQTDYLDLLQIHRFDPTVSPEETMRALHDLVVAGKVRYLGMQSNVWLDQDGDFLSNMMTPFSLGASSMWTYQFAQLQECAERHNWTKFVSMQNHYSLCYREEEREMNKYCHETGVGLIPWAPLYRGLLARPLGSSATTREETSKGGPGPLAALATELTTEDTEIVRRVQELAEKHGWKMGQVALAWILQKGTIPVVGCSSLARLDEACEMRGKTLSDQEMKYLEEPYKPKAVAGHN